MRRAVVGVPDWGDGRYFVYMSLGVFGWGSENVVFFSDRLSASLHITQMNLPACQLEYDRV
jgi:hypothetical protein